MSAGLVNGDAIERFCRDRADRMKQPATAAVYAGLADRVKRGAFYAEALEQVRVADDAGVVVVRCVTCGWVRDLQEDESVVAIAEDALDHVGSMEHEEAVR